MTVTTMQVDCHYCDTPIEVEVTARSVKCDCDMNGTIHTHVILTENSREAAEVHALTHKAKRW